MRLCLDPACSDGATLEDGTPGPRRVADDLTGNLCRRCLGHLERRLAELVAQRDALRAVLGGSSGGQGGGTSRPKPGSRPPLNVAAHDHLEHLHALAVSWVLLVCEERDLRGPDRNDLSALAPWLLSQLDWIAGQGWVGDLAEEMRDAARVADGITRAQPAWHRLEAPCTACGAFELGRLDGDAYVECRSCGQTWPEEHYGVLVRAVVDSQTVTSQEAAKALGLAYGSFRNLLSEERCTLKPFATLNGEARYLRQDVDDLAATRAEGDVA